MKVTWGILVMVAHGMCKIVGKGEMAIARIQGVAVEMEESCWI